MLWRLFKVAALFLLWSAQPSATQVLITNNYSRTVSGGQLTVLRSNNSTAIEPCFSATTIPQVIPKRAPSQQNEAGSQVSFNFSEPHFMTVLLPYINENTLPFTYDPSACIHRYQGLVREFVGQVRAFRRGTQNALSDDYLASVMMLELFSFNETELLDFFQARFLPSKLKIIVNKSLLSSSIYLHVANSISLHQNYFMYAADFIPDYRITKEDCESENDLLKSYIQKKIYQEEKKIYEMLRDEGSGNTIRYLARKIKEASYQNENKEVGLIINYAALFQLAKNALSSALPKEYLSKPELQIQYGDNKFIKLSRMSLLIETGLKEHNKAMKGFVCRLQPRR